MTAHEDNSSIDKEPQFQQRSYRPDAAEDKAAGQLARERAAADPDAERAQHSVFDEPVTLPNRPSILIDRDWSCRNCGYNLRGLMTGHPCPECGRIERYEPPREGEITYAQWADWHATRPSWWAAWLVAAAAAVASSPLALFAACLTTEYVGLLNFVVFGPAISEVLKIALALTIIERGGRRIRSTGQIYLMTLGTSLVFAVVQNVLYLLVYYKNPAGELVAYRWTVCVLLHGLCTLIATRGLLQVWVPSQREQRPTMLRLIYPTLTVAIVLHAAYNACVFMSGAFGFGF